MGKGGIFGLIDDAGWFNEVEDDGSDMMTTVVSRGFVVCAQAGLPCIPILSATERAMCVFIIILVNMHRRHPCYWHAGPFSVR